MADREWTILKALNWTTHYFEDHHIPDARLAAQILLSFALGIKKIELYTNFDRVLSEDQRSRFRDLIKRRIAHEPVQYITGSAEFMSYPFSVSPAVLIPRGETEILVDEVMQLAKKRYPSAGKIDIIDLCTGSGCIAVAMVKLIENAFVYATDVSGEAVAIARENAARNEVSERVEFSEGNLFEPLRNRNVEGAIDIVTANPPYVSEDEYETLPPEVKDFEPKEALLGGKEGLDLYPAILQGAQGFLKPGGALFIEIGYNQGQKVKALVEKFKGMQFERLVKDYQDLDRVLCATRI